MLIKKEIVGVVTDVRYERRSKETRFVVKNSSEFCLDVTCNNSIFFPIAKNDHVNLIGTKLNQNEREWRIHPGSNNFVEEYEEQTSNEVIPPPCGIISHNKESVIDFFIKECRLTQNKAQSLYNLFQFKSIAILNNPTDLDLFKYICNEFETLHKAYISRSFFTITLMAEKYKNLFDEEIYAKIAKIWYKKIILRSFYLFGLNKKIINNLRKHDNKLTLIEIFEKMKENPLLMVALNINSAINIALQLRMKMTTKQIDSAILARQIIDEIDEMNGIAIPATNAIQKFGSDRMIELKKDLRLYSLKYDDEMRSIYTLQSHYDEITLSNRIVELFYKENPCLIPENLDSELLDSYNLCDEQRHTVEHIFDSCISMILGGPGTGKTTIIRAITGILERYHLGYVLTAFSGKAVDRMSSATGRSAFTLNRLQNITDLHDIETCANNTDLTAIILDEASMAPSNLISKILSKYPTLKYFIIVGDMYQLQPVTGGEFLIDLIETKLIEPFTLKFNHRQSVAPNLATTLQRLTLKFQPDDTSRFEFKKGNDCNVIYGGQQDLINFLEKMKTKPDFNLDSLAVITPYRDPAKFINLEFKRIFYPEVPSDDEWFVGARVIQLVNDYDIEVMNGKEGVVTKVNKEENYIIVKYDEEVKYSTNSPPQDNDQVFNENELDWNENLTDRVRNNAKSDDNLPYTTSISLSYATTIHKYQGSERENIICYFPKHGANSTMLTRPLINVGLSRATKSLTVIGFISDVIEGTDRAGVRRFSNLTKRILSQANL